VPATQPLPTTSAAASITCSSTNTGTPTACNRPFCSSSSPQAALTVVGDDAQSIYSFRAATVRNILDFPKKFNPPAAVITLDRNYRSTVPIRLVLGQLGLFQA